MAKLQLDAILKLVDVQINPQVFRKISQSVAGMPTNLQLTVKGLNNASNAAGGLNRQLKQTGQQLSINEKAARLLLQRMAQFAILLPTFATMNRAIQGSVKFLFEFDSALRDIVRTDVKGLSSRIEEIGDAALKTATEFGVLAQEVLNTVKTFVQAGDTIEVAQEKARLAIIATQVSTLSAADAVEFFISASEQFRLSGESLTNALDALVIVEDLAAVEAQDIAEAFRTGGNSFAEFGKDINAGIGLISALREQTRKSGREIGTFFKTLQTRIFAAGEARDAVEGLGVEVQNLDGSLRPTLDVLNDLKTAFDGLTEAQVANAAKAIGGVRQFESLIATLNSLDRANELTAEGQRAAGAAAQKRTVTDQKLEIQLGKLIAQGQAFAEALGDAGGEEALRGILKVATAILEIFTSITKTIDGLGGNLAPLIALGAVGLGKSVFGFSKPGGPGGPGGVAGALGASAAGANPLLNQAQKQLQPAIMSVRDQMSLLGTASKNGVLAMTNYVRSIAANTQGQTAAAKQASAAQMQFAIEARNAARLLKANQTPTGGGIGAIGKSGLGSTLVGLAGATVIPQIFNGLQEGASEAKSAMWQTAETSLSLGATFLATGNVVAAAGALLAGALGSLASQAVDAYRENQKYKDQQIELDKERTRTLSAKSLLTGEADFAKEFQRQLLDSLKTNVRNLGAGAGIQKTIEEGTSFKAARDRGIQSENLRQALFSDIDVLKKFIANQQDYIESLSEAAGRTDEVQVLNDLLANTGNTIGNDIGPAFTQLTEAIGATGAAAGSADAEIRRVSMSLAEISKVRELQRVGEEFRNLSLQLELAKAGPEALTDNVLRMSNGILLAERQLRGQRFDQQLVDIFTRLTPNGGDIKLKSGDLISADQFIVKLTDGLNSVDPQKVAAFNQLMMDIPDTLQPIAKEVIGILIEQQEAELDLQNLKNDKQKEVTERARKLLEEENKASIAAFEAMSLFNAELQKFGDSVTQDVLGQFQNITLGDVEGVLAGQSDLGAGLQEIIMSAFGDDKGASRVAKAQTELRSVSEQTEAQLATLAQKLDLVNQKLADQAYSNDTAALTGEKLSLQLDMEKAIQEGAVKATEAKIKVLEAERKAAEEAAEKQRKLNELLEKLAEASRDFENELREVRRGFDEFAQETTADLLSQEADAQSELKDAQQEVLSTTSALADAQKALSAAYLELNGVFAEAKIKSALLGRDIALLTGGISTFDGRLTALNNAFTEVLNNANISLEKRISLERQLAEETLSFLQQARDEIVQAGLGVFGQSGAENQQLGEGIAGLQFVAETLGGSFENFLSLTQGELAGVTDVLLSLPVDFRQTILDALSFLPSTANIGGFSVDQLQQAIGQIGAGVAPEEGLPSIEELNSQQVEQLKRLQELAMQDAMLQVSQVVSAQKELEAAQEAAEAAKLLQERASEELANVRDAVLEESAILDLASQKQQELLAAVIAADDRNTLQQIEKEAQLFADQNIEFAKIGDNIVKGIASLINSRLAVIGAASDVAAASNYGGYIPNFAGGNLTPGEAAGLLRAAAREKRMMPGGAGLAVANTSEAIIPMHNRGYIPNFQSGNFDSIAAGIASIKQINETMVAAIAQSVGNALSNLNTGGGNTEEQLLEVITQLRTLNETLDSVNESNAVIQANTEATATGGTGGTQTNATQEVRIRLETNQNTSVAVTGLSALREEIAEAVKSAASEQVDTQLQSLLKEFDSVILALQERGLLSSLGQVR